MSDSSIVIIQGTVGFYTVATRCHTCFAVTLKYTEDSSLTEIQHSLLPKQRTNIEKVISPGNHVIQLQTPIGKKCCRYLK